MEKERMVGGIKESNNIINEEYFYVDIKNEKVLTKIQYTSKWSECLSFVNGRWITNYIWLNTIQEHWQIINKDVFEKEINNEENNLKIINGIKNELEYTTSFDKTEKRFFDMLNKRKDLNKDKILNALNFAKEKHLWQVRDEWTQYIIHPMSVAVYAMKDWLDTDAVVVCLLHDVVEDTQEDYDKIQNDILELFWERVLIMVNKLSKRMKDRQKEINEYHEDMSTDVLVTKIKWFDRLHNVYSLFLQPKKEKVVKYIEKTKKEILPLVSWTEICYNIENILKIIEKNTKEFDLYKEKIDNIKEIKNKKKEL